jgi:penicillin V acylase-like amidase (Ntn superfamily)
MLPVVRGGLYVLVALISSLLPAPAVEACVYQGLEDRYITGRTFDWGAEITSNLWTFPRGMERHGAAGPRSVEWTSR